MIKIHPLRPQEIRQVLAMLKRYSEPERAEVKDLWQLYLPFHQMTQMLPLSLQCMPAIYVAITERKVLGLIWLNRDGRQTRRLKIDHLLLDPEAVSYDIGTQLVQYIINHYGGEGVQTFLASVDQYYDTGLALLKSCGFRRCTRLHTFETELARLENKKSELPGLRESHNGDAEKLEALYNEILPSEVRVSLAKSQADFEFSLFQDFRNKLQGLFFKRWVLEDEARDCITTALEISTQDYQTFTLNLLIHPGWEHLLPEALAAGCASIQRMTHSATVHVECFEFQKETIQCLEQEGFSRLGIAEVLVKDYWIPIEDKGFRLQSPILLFSSKPTPATQTRY